MKKSLLAIFSFFLSFQLFSQTTIRIGQHDAIRINWSAWSVPGTTTNFNSVQEGQQIIQNILRAVDRRANFEIRTANIDNAAAVVYGGKRYVLYNPNFINALVRQTGNDWSAISVLAHEVGHHLEGHTTAAQGSHPAIELEADEFSGYALRRMGASLSDAQAAMRLIASTNATATHPGRSSRLAAIEKGWASADQRNSDNNDMADSRQTNPVRTSPNSRTQESEQTSGSTTSRSVAQTILEILGQILTSQSNNRSSGLGSFITNGYNVLMQVNNKWQDVGRLARLNDARYPYMIYDQANTRLYVDRQGKVVNKRGQYVGQLRSV